MNLRRERPRMIDKSFFIKEIKPVNLKEINPDYIERTEAEAPVLWPSDGKSQLIGKDPDAGKD